MNKPLVLFTAGIAIALAAACSSGDDEPGKGSPPPAKGCAADHRKDEYAPGMTKAAGDLSVKLVEATPAPPAKGDNTLTLELTDAAGNVVDGATVTVTPFMPDHAHGSAVTPVVTPAGGGRYTVSKVYLAMAGLWRLTVSVQMPGGGPLKEAAFQFCLDG